ncbi:hypothetical protein BT93_J2094 [Corymbia citriodora subsp. variegata]|nr:hypothetical protein BT93_J2094 [Corymbia citriodora subsp. variegata]
MFDLRLLQPPLHCPANSKQKRTKTVRIFLTPKEAGQIAKRCDKSMFELQHLSFRITNHPGGACLLSTCGCAVY